MRNRIDEIITMDHGSGGQKTSALIERMFVPAFDNAALKTLGDGAVLKMEGSGLVFSTDSFVVSPCFFPGGDIGKLSVCGTVNDIAMSGGIPKYLSLALILEEGFPTDDLQRIVASVSRTAGELGVKIVTGDTKVVEKGKGDGIYINTAGIGVLAHEGLSTANIRVGDAVIVSGPVGEHGVAVMLARNPDLIQSTILSDCAPVSKIAQELFSLQDDLHLMRDPTRGGIATTLCEFVEGGYEVRGDLSIELKEADIPVKREVQAACDILGLDPLYCACEGRLLAVVAPEKAAKAVELINKAMGISQSSGSSATLNADSASGKDAAWENGAAVIGTVTDRYPGRVVLHTVAGGTRVLSKLAGSQLPRIC